MRKKGEELVFQVAGRLRPVQGHLLSREEAADVPSDEAAVGESAVAKERTSIDQGLLDRAVLCSEAGFVGFDLLPAGESGEDVGGRLWIYEEITDMPTKILCLGVPGKVQLSRVGPEDTPVGAYPAQAECGVLEESSELILGLGQAHFARPHRLRRA